MKINKAVITAAGRHPDCDGRRVIGGPDLAPSQPVLQWQAHEPGSPPPARRLVRGNDLQQRVVELGFAQGGGRCLGVADIETLDRHGDLRG